MMRPLCYIAGPYRAPEAHSDLEREARVADNVEKAAQASLLVAQRGWAPVCPHTMSQPIDALDANCALSDQDWLDITLALCVKCDAILLLPGWVKSEGARAEHRAMVELGRRTFYELNEVAEV